MSLMCPPLFPLSPHAPWHDPELERLRGLQRMRMIEEEKERIRQWLREHGMPASPFVSPTVPSGLPMAPRPGALPRKVSEVLERLG